MGRLIETVGRYAENPYYIVQTDTPVYCIEELCFVLCQNTFLLDRGLLDMKLAKWLEEECGLRELARKLYVLISRNESPSSFVGTILEYAHFGSSQKRRETEDLLRTSADMDAATRRKYFADYMVENEHYSQAILEYERMLEEIPSMNYVMRSQVLHNRGVAFGRLFCFEEAAESFFAAYRENAENGEELICYLTALRMSLTEEAYIALVAEHPDWHGASLAVEERMEESKRGYEDSGACRELQELLKRRDTGYYEKVSEKLTGMRKNYREMVASP